MVEILKCNCSNKSQASNSYRTTILQNKGGKVKKIIMNYRTRQTDNHSYMMVFLK